MDDEDLDEMWDCSFLQLVSARDRLIQLKILHRIYLTPVRLHRIYFSVPADCGRCVAASVSFIHIFFSDRCPHIQTFWMAIASFILLVTTIQLPLRVYVCMLGLVDPLAHHRASRTLLELLLFYARKAIVLKWKCPAAILSTFGKG